MYIYLIIFIIILILFIVYPNINKTKVEWEPFRNIKPKSKPKLKKKTMKEDIRDIKAVLSEYRNDIQNLEFRLKMKGIIDNKNIKPLKKFKNRNRDIMKDLYYNIERFDNKSKCDKDSLASDKQDQLEQSINMENDIIKVGKYSDIFDELHSLPDNPIMETEMEESLMTIKTEDMDKMKKNLLNKGTHVYQYTDNNKREIYRIYQKGNLLTMKEDTLIDILSQKQVRLTSGKKNRLDLNILDGIELVSVDSINIVGSDKNIIKLDKHTGINIESEDTLNINGSYNNNINLDINGGTKIQSNTNIDLHQISIDEKTKGSINMDKDSVRTLHTDRIVIKVGTNVILIDKDSIDISGQNINLFSSDSVSIITKDMNIDADNLTINSNVDIIGQTSLYNNIDINGSFNHHGQGFTSTLTNMVSVNKINMLNKCFNDIKKKNQNHITKIQQLNGINMQNIQDDINDELTNKLETTKQKFQDILKNEVLNIANKVGLGGAVKTMIKTGVAIYNKEQSTLKEVKSEINQKSTTLTMSPGQFDLTNSLAGGNALEMVFDKLKTYSDEKIQEVLTILIDKLPFDKYIDKFVDKIKESKLAKTIKKDLLYSQKVANKMYNKNKKLINKVGTLDKYASKSMDYVADKNEKISNYASKASDISDRVSNISDRASDKASQYTKEDFINRGFKINKQSIANKVSNLSDKVSNVSDKISDTSNTILDKTDKVSDKLSNISDKYQTAKDKLQYMKDIATGDISLDDEFDQEIDIIRDKIKDGLKDSIYSNLQKWLDDMDTYALNILLKQFQNIFKGLDKLPSTTSISLNTDEVSFGCGEPTMLNMNKEECKIHTVGQFNTLSSLTNFTCGECNLISDTAINIQGKAECSIVCGPGEPNSSIMMEPENIQFSGIKEFINGATNITGPIAIEGETNITGALQVEGDSNFTGAVEIEGDLNIVGAVEIEGELASGNITAPTAEIAEVTGNCTNALNALNAENAENAEFADNAATAEFAFAAPI